MRTLRYVVNEIVNILFIIVLALGIFIAIREYILQPFQVEGSSMEPQLSNGYQMIMFKQGDFERFDVVVFPDPRGTSENYVKRIIGLPGDSLEVNNDQLYINDLVVEEPYLQPLKDQSEPPYTQDFSLRNTVGLEIVPEGYVFVLGDNRPNSGDSRQFGLVPIDSIAGHASLVYYPFDEFGFLPDYELNSQSGAVSQSN